MIGRTAYRADAGQISLMTPSIMGRAAYRVSRSPSVPGGSGQALPTVRHHRIMREWVPAKGPSERNNWDSIFPLSSPHPQKNEHRNAVPVFHFLAVLSKRDYPGKTGIHAGKTPAPIGRLGRKGSWRSGHRMDSPTSRRPLSRRLPLSPFTSYAIPYSP